MNDDELDIELRSPAEVATRAIILASLIRRLSIESLADEAHDETLGGEVFDLRAWLQSQNLWDHLGDVYDKLGKADKARDAWGKALERAKKEEAPNAEEIKVIETKLEAKAGP